jgi:hypothetical protein
MNNINKISWELIFINNDEFKAYLNINDLKELSMTSSITRLKTKPKLYSNFFISNNINTLAIEDLENLNIIPDSSINCIYEFQVAENSNFFNRHLRRFLPYINNVNIGFFARDYHLMEVSILLPKLTSLSLSNTTLTYNTFKLALNNLPNLEILIVKSASFTHYTNRYPITQIKVPDTLKYINWSDLRYYISDMEESYLSLGYRNYETILEKGVLQFCPHKFQNLQKYTSYMLPPDFDKTLILNNPQLTWINFKIRILNEARVTIFNLFKNVKKLELSVDRILGIKDDIKFCFPSLTSLYFYKVNSRTWKLLEKIVLSSPSLAQLEIEFNFDPDIEAPPKLMELINSTPKLQKLFIKSSKSIKLNFENISPSAKLQFLKISFDADIISVLNKLYKIPNIKAVSFRKYFHKEIPLFNQNLKIEFWRLIDIQEYLSYYKIH